MIPTEIICSAVIGFAISILLINFGSQSAPQTLSDANTLDETLPDDSASSTENGLQPMVYLDEDTVIKRSKFLQESLGLSSESIKEAVRQTNEELRREPATSPDVNTIMQDNSLNIFSVLLDYLVFGVVLAICLYSVNSLMKGDLLKMFTALFRTELESIKLSKLPIFIKRYFNIQEDI
eukprot:gene22142-30378_t